MSMLVAGNDDSIAEAKLRRLQCLIEVLSSASGLIGRATSRRELFESLCDLGNRPIQFQLTWFGWLREQGNGAVLISQPIQERGFSIHQAECAINSVMALSGKSYVCSASSFYDQLPADCASRRSNGDLGQCGSFPIVNQGKVSGALCLHATDKGFFGTDELILIQKLATDLSFAIDRLDSDAARQRAEEQLNRERAFSRVVLDSVPGGIIACDEDGEIRVFNRSAQEMLGEGPLDTTFMRQPPKDTVIRDFSTLRPTIAPDAAARRLLGETAPLLDGEGKTIGAVLTVEDISSTAALEDQLRESERRHQALLDNMAEGVAVCRMIFDGDQPLDFVYLAVNKSYKRMRGGRNLVGKRASRVIPDLQKSDPQLFAAYGRVARSGVPERFETFVTAFDEWLSINCYSAGTDCFVVVFDVITEQKLVQESLLESEDRYRSLFEHACDMYLVLKLGADMPVIVAVNEAFERGHGFQRSELIGQPVSILEPGLTLADAAERNRRVHEGLPLYMKHRHKDGSWFEVEAVVRDVRLGSDDCVFVVERDISELKMTEAALRQKTVLLERAGVLAQIGTLEWDLESGLVTCSAELYRLYGVSPEESPKPDIESALAFIHPDDQAPMRDSLDKLIVNGESPSWEYRICRRDGSIRHLRTTAVTRMGPAGNPSHVLGLVQDITEMKDAEAIQRRAAAYNRSLIEASVDPLVTIGSDGRITDVNQATERATGLDRAELIGSDFCSYFVNPDHARMAYQEAFREGRACDCALELRHVDGHTTSVVYSASVYRDEYGVVAGVFAAARDITRRCRAEEQLRRSEEFLRLAVDGAEMGVWSLDIERGELSGTERAKALLCGKGTAEALSILDVLNCIHPDDRRRVSEKLALSMEQNIPFHEEYRCLRPDGSVYWVGSRGHTNTESRQGTPSLAGIVVDVTQRKRDEEALREAEARWKFALEGAGDGVWDHNIVTGEAFFSRRWKSVLGYRNDEIVPRVEEWSDRIHPADKDFVLGLREGCERGSVPEYQSEYRMRCKDGSYRWILDRGMVLERNFSGQAIRLIGTQSDISDRKRAQEEQEQLREQLQQAHKMESIGRLAGGVAHDFNNILTVINGYSELALQKLNPTDPLARPVSEINKAGLRAATLVQQLLAFSRKQVLKSRPINLNELIADSRDMLQRLIGEDIILVTRLDPELSAIHADTGQMNQVVMNLFSNARDSMPEGGTLTVSTANIQMDGIEALAHHGLAPGSYVLLEVSDTGSGIDPEIVDHIFEPFFTTKSEGRGTGLGLSTVYGIVRQSGGSIEAQSRLGVGSTFRVFLPRTDFARDEVSTKVDLVDPMKGCETILVVEDQPAVRAWIVQILEECGYTVLDAADGAAALEVFETYSGPVHVVLTDVVMPGISGIQLAEELRVRRPETMVILMSGCAGDIIRQHGHPGPATQLLTKPFDAETLRARVHETLFLGRRHVRVLVVDDDTTVREYIDQVLSEAGYDVLLAKDGNEALERLSIERIDLVITDLVMPEREGIDLIRTIRKSYDRVKVIAMSGAFGGQFLPAAEALGAAACIGKPLQSKQLTETIARVMHERIPD